MNGFGFNRRNTFCNVPFQRTDSLKLPISQPYNPNIGYGAGLTVPNQLVINSWGFDGTRTDVGSGPGYWGNRMMSNPFGSTERYWNDNEIYSLHQELTDKDIEYNTRKNIEDEKLRRSLSDFQKKLLQQFGVVRGSHWFDVPG